MEQVTIQVAVQVPALFLVSFVFLQVLKLVLNQQGAKIDKLADGVSDLTVLVKEVPRVDHHH